MSTSAVKRLTVDEFLALEETSEVRHEYFDGEIFAMAGGSAKHSTAKVNFMVALGNALRDSGCLVLNSDMMVLCPTGLRTYPDISVTCEQPTFEDDRERVLLNPRLIVEVLSESTEAYDRGRKFDNYQSIPSLASYVLVAADRMQVDCFTRQPSGDWLLKKYNDPGTQIELPAAGCSIPMAEIYANVTFDEPTSAANDDQLPGSQVEPS